MTRTAVGPVHTSKRTSETSYFFTSRFRSSMVRAMKDAVGSSGFP